MKTSVPPISLAGSELGEVRHVCALFNSDDEEYRVLLPFIKDGFECGDKAIHVVNRDQRGDHLQRLSAAGIDTASAQQKGQFDLRTNTETYLRDGRFDQDRMLEVFEQAASGNAKGGFPLSRIVCRMDWAAEGRTHLDNLIEFESRVNDVWRASRRRGHLHLPFGAVQRRHRDRPHANTSGRHHRRNSAAEPVLYPTGAVSARISSAERKADRAPHHGLR